MKYCPGVGVASIYRILREYKANGKLESPKVYRRARTVLDNVSDETKSGIRRIVHTFFSKNEPPTVKKILTAVNENPIFPDFKITTMRTLLKEIGFR